MFSTVARAGIIAIAALWGFVGLMAISSCSAPHVPYIRGTVETDIRNDTFHVDYNLVIKRPGIDSVALQVSPSAYWRAWVPASDRLIDSLLGSIGDTLPCCRAADWTVSSSDQFRVISDTLDPEQILAAVPRYYCWWTTPIALLYPSFLHKIPLEKLRQRSIPCSWVRDREKSHSAVVDSSFQSDSIIYRCGDRNLRESAQPVITGSLTFADGNRLVPRQYWLKIYGKEFETRDDYLHMMPALWDDLFPRSPHIDRFDFVEDGHMVGMLGGIGISRLSYHHESDSYGDTGSHTAVNLLLGFSYYATRSVCHLRFDLNYVDRDRYLDVSSLPAVHYYFGKRVMHGLSLHLAPGYSELAQEGVPDHIHEKDFDFQAGWGYDTDFDRLSYTYHTAHDGYHEIEMLAGFMAIQQGKAGLKLSVLRGERMRMTTLQVYMQNRIDPTTMTLRGPRSLMEQALIYAAMTAFWFALD